MGRVHVVTGEVQTLRGLATGRQRKPVVARCTGTVKTIPGSGKEEAGLDMSADRTISEHEYPEYVTDRNILFSYREL
ncbi:MAG: hypothetical protein LBR26_05365 [Prevotella sp.]|nr:hypothetical protein [Prevotella sp.]